MRKKFGLRRYAGLTAVVAIAATAMVVFVGGASAIVAGAGYTTTNIPPDPAGSCFNGPGLVNCNIYAAKTAVWINGGPTNGTSALSDGTYFFVVGVPGGENSDINDAAVVPDDGTGTALNLSDDFDSYTNREFTVVNHHIAGTSGTPRLHQRKDSARAVFEYDQSGRRVLRRHLPDRPGWLSGGSVRVQVRQLQDQVR